MGIWRRGLLGLLCAGGSVAPVVATGDGSAASQAHVVDHVADVQPLTLSNIETFTNDGQTLTANTQSAVVYPLLVNNTGPGLNVQWGSPGSATSPGSPLGSLFFRATPTNTGVYTANGDGSISAHVGGTDQDCGLVPQSIMVAEVDQISFNSNGSVKTLAAQFDCSYNDGSYEISGTVAYNILPTTPKLGYYLFEGDGSFTGFGNDSYLNYLGDLSTTALNQPVVAMATTPDDAGYWMVAGDGGVFSYGDAGFYGSTGKLRLNKPVEGMASTPDGAGYWFVGSDGGIFAYGDAGFHGSTGSLRLNQPVVGMAATHDGGGYWLVASDGGIFAFGDAGYFGSMGGKPLNKPIVGMATTPDGKGYWLVASDGGIFAFGDASFYGSAGSIQLNQPIVGMTATPDSKGYWFVASDGGVFNYGDAPFDGSLGGSGVFDAAGLAT